MNTKCRQTTFENYSFMKTCSDSYLICYQQGVHLLQTKWIFLFGSNKGQVLVIA